MKFSQLAEKLDQKQIEDFEHAAVWKPAVMRGLGWREASLDPSSVQSAIELLSVYARAFLKEMLRAFAALPSEEEKLLQAVRKNTAMSGAECRIGLSELKEAGIVFSVRKVWGERICFIPAECFVLWQQALWPLRLEALTEQQQECLMNGQIRPFRRPLGKQLLSGFAALAKSGMELTSKGVLHKKTVARLAQAVDLEEALLQPFGLNWLHKEHYPLKAAFVLEAGTAFGLLRTEQDALKWNEDRLSHWLSKGEADRENDLLEWCMGLLLPAGGSHAHNGAALTALQADIWYSGREIEAWSGELEAAAATPHDASLTQSKPSPCWLGLFYNFGWMEVVDCESIDLRPEMFFRWKGVLGKGPGREVLQQQAEESFRHISVQPNGELIADPACPFSIRWELELLAELITDERIAVYRMEQQTVALALENGRTRHSIRTFLESASGGEPLPAAFEALLEVWCGRACRSWFAEVVLLRCDNEQMAAILDNHPGAATMLTAKLGNTDYIVSKAHVSELRRLLQQAGYPPRKGVLIEEEEQGGYPSVIRFFPDKGVQQTEQGSKTAAYVYEAFPLQHFELEVQDASSRMPLLQTDRIPAIWTKQLRAYHHSTRKELIEQALAWQTPVQLRMRQELNEFVPEKLEQKDGAWAVVGLLRSTEEKQQIRLTPDMWDEMRLVIPGRGELI
ncbi:helicase-associated domain-containing protein [Paenibacillus sp. N4]|uniref:helicase-associated domain-containing protein n=1 Tax=Paenibacillus vietnamensis TaxID=2590547 RepID=UPI001CD12AB0|nr:helicase-associated domain-containing protein [Paenibacillus vietnamensis]MCA0753924.1 helicase-associated domain-containing protein [Paenibacillus vietnamensis]